MNDRKLKITFMSPDDIVKWSIRRVGEAIRTRKPHIQPPDLKIWASVEAYQQFMSDQKYAILAAIARHQPNSVYELAKILNRAHQNVARDCNSLKGHGFIKFVKVKSSRRAKAPRLAFDYSVIEVHLPNLAYSIDLKSPAA